MYSKKFQQKNRLTVDGRFLLTYMF